MPKLEARPNIAELRCPVCGHKDSFRIQVREYVLMSTDYKKLWKGTEDRWGPSSPCVCPDCHYQGAVLDFRPASRNTETCHG